jgi:hypothetical protein
MSGAINYNKVQYVTSINFNMKFNIPICILLLRHYTRNYNFLFFYHVNNFLQLNFNLINIYYKCFSNTNTNLQLLFNILTQSQCTHIFNINLCLRSDHPCFQIFFIHCTSHAICKLNRGLLIEGISPSSFSSLHYQKHKQHTI